MVHVVVSKDKLWVKKCLKISCAFWTKAISDFISDVREVNQMASQRWVSDGTEFEKSSPNRAYHCGKNEHAIQ